MQQTNPYNDVKLSQLKMYLQDQADKNEVKYSIWKTVFFFSFGIIAKND